MSISKERNMFVAIERFISHTIKIHGKHNISNEMEVHGIRRKLGSF